MRIDSRSRRGKVGCLGYVALAFLGLLVIGLLSKSKTNTPHVQLANPEPLQKATPSPPSTPRQTFHVGDVATLQSPGARAVLVATTDESWNDMLDAQNALADGKPGAEVLIRRLILTGRANVFPVGTRVVVVKVSFASRFVEVVDGPDIGEGGWIQYERLGPDTLPEPAAETQNPEPKPRPTITAKATPEDTEQSTKASRSLLSMGTNHAANGNDAKAIAAFEELVVKHPKTNEAIVAKKRLASLKPTAK